MRLVRQGDARAFEQLVDRHRDALSRYCRGVTGHAQDAEEAFQTTLIKAYQAIRRGDRVTALRPWLIAIARNACVDLIRQRPDWQTLTTEQAARGDDPGDMQVTRERFEGLRRDLADLKELHRSALLLRELNGMSHREIGDALGTSPESAKRLIFEARESLVERAAGRELDCADVRARISEHDGRMLRSRRLRAHLDECACCAEYRATLVNRPRQLAAMFPVLPAAVAARILQGLGLGGGAAAGGGGVAALAGSVGGGSLLGGLSVQTAAILGVLTIGGATMVPGLLVADRVGQASTKFGEAAPVLSVTDVGAHHVLTTAAVRRIQETGPGSISLLTGSGASVTSPRAQERTSPAPVAAASPAVTRPDTAPAEPAGDSPAPEPPAPRNDGRAGGTQPVTTSGPAVAAPDTGTSTGTRAGGGTAGVGEGTGGSTDIRRPGAGGGAAAAPISAPSAPSAPAAAPVAPVSAPAVPAAAPSVPDGGLTGQPAGAGDGVQRPGSAQGTPPSPPSGVDDTGAPPAPPAVTPAPVPSGPSTGPQEPVPPSKAPTTKPPATKVPATEVPATEVPTTKVPGTKVPPSKAPPAKGDGDGKGDRGGHDADDDETAGDGCHAHDGGRARGH
ncbi:MAG: sigma-70 family RNA polymerase sigma factor [Thermoleophilia bacterium]|nr:sigma-70 family RNA polymerase sigma factor [Thermoleophilia bacterium]